MPQMRGWACSGNVPSQPRRPRAAWAASQAVWAAGGERSFCPCGTPPAALLPALHPRNREGLELLVQEQRRPGRSSSGTLLQQRQDETTLGFSLEKRMFWGDPIEVFHCQERDDQNMEENLFYGPRVIDKGIGFKLKEGRFGLDIRK